MGDAGNAGKQTAASRRFAAFISYSHADARAAADLQRRLERYRLPKRIADARGQRPSLGSIFRDREDLAAASSLNAAIRDAIAQAEALIVICSPGAAASPWVAAEIELFRELHPDKPILAALLSGGPAISFPAALTADGNEPLAADLRPEGDGPQLGFLKIVAGIAGVPLDALIQRDAQRRIRRVTAITVGALAAMLIMAVMTTFALSARNEAARQLAASDGLVEYMLTDLREKLRGVGRSEIMSAVNRRALDHYAAQGDLAQLPADSLEHRARVLHAMGEDEERAGKLDRAIQRFREAHATTAALLARKPRNPDRIFAHAQSEYYVGMAALKRSDRVGAARHWRAYLTRARALANAEPSSHRSHMELGYAEGNLCELALKDRYNLAAAERHCRASIAHEERALVAKPGDQKTRQDIANRWGWLAQVQMEQANWQAAVQSRQNEKALMMALVDGEPDNVEYAIRLSWALIGEATAHLGQKNYLKAQTLLANALNNYDRMTAQVTGDNRIAPVRMRLLGWRAKAETMHRGKVRTETSIEIAETLHSDPNGELAKLYGEIIKKGM